MRVADQLNASLTADEILNAGLVSSSQNGVHPRLQQVVQRHLDTHWSQPLHRPSVEVYRHFKSEYPLGQGQKFMLDSGCGTAKSTQKLASRHPGHLVVGVDRSEARLAKSGMSLEGTHEGLYQYKNCVLLRADLPTFWRLLARDGHIPDKHYLLYPNPWPKAGHLKRRWHGHPVFPQLLAMGGEIELRCNWDIYAQEFALAAGFVTGEAISAQNYLSGKHVLKEAISAFERKYLDRGQSLYSVKIPGQVTNAFRCSRQTE